MQSISTYLHPQELPNLLTLTNTQHCSPAERYNTVINTGSECARQAKRHVAVER